MQPLQYPLAVNLPEDITFDTFYGAEQSTAVAWLKHYISEPLNQPPVYLFGASGCGKTHLLYSACMLAQQQGRRCQMLALNDCLHFSVQILDNLEQLDLICLDNIESIAGNLLWQTAVFDLYNRITEQGKALIITADNAAATLAITLPDLTSRLQACTNFQLRLLTDDDKQKLLQQKARERGLVLSEDVARYLLNRQERDLHSLIQILNLLDQASIVHQRKLTIPFIKEVLG